MGTDKACLPLRDGRLLWQRQHSMLVEAGARRVFLSVRRDQDWAAGEIHCVHDTVPGAGPIAGILAAFERSTASHLFVLAVDLPWLPVDWLRELARECRVDSGACGRLADGSFEPLASVYPRSWMAGWRDAMLGGGRSLQRLLASAGDRGKLFTRPVAPREEAWFHNLNHPRDLDDRTL